MPRNLRDFYEQKCCRLVIAPRLSTDFLGSR